MHFTRLHLIAAGLLSGPGLVAAGKHSRRGVDCFFEMPAESGDTCESFAGAWGTSLDLFTKINPGVTCPDLQVGKSYCVLGEWTPDETTTSSTTSPVQSPTTTTTTTPSPTDEPSTTSKTTTTSSTTTPAPVPTNSPAMPGIAPTCDRFYKIKSGDQCDSIAASNGITVGQLRSWNTEINAACTNLWLDYYICTRVPGAVLPTTTSTAPTPSNSPAMPGVDPKCSRFHKIKSGDQCDSIAAGAGISVAQLKSWNTEINAACTNLWLDYYICTLVPGAVLPTTTSAAPAPTNSPVLPGAVSNCNKWYKIASGNTCETIAPKNTITMAQFRKWNTQINTSCSNLWVGYYACVGIPGAATPMPGIVSNCSRFYQVVSGDGCDSIAQKSAITVANFRRWNPYINSACTNLWADALVCNRA